MNRESIVTRNDEAHALAHELCHSDVTDRDHYGMKTSTLFLFQHLHGNRQSRADSPPQNTIIRHRKPVDKRLLLYVADTSHRRRHRDETQHCSAGTTQPPLCYYRTPALSAKDVHPARRPIDPPYATSLLPYTTPVVPENVRALHELPILRLENKQRQHARKMRQLLARHILQQRVQVGHLAKEMCAGLHRKNLATRASSRTNHTTCVIGFAYQEGRTEEDDGFRYMTSAAIRGGGVRNGFSEITHDPRNAASTCDLGVRRPGKNGPCIVVNPPLYVDVIADVTSKIRGVGGGVRRP